MTNFTAFVARGTSGECPIICNNCVIGVGSTIIGGAYLADGIAVAGCPAKKISDNGKEKWNNKTISYENNE